MDFCLTSLVINVANKKEVNPDVIPYFTTSSSIVLLLITHELLKVPSSFS